MVNNFHNLTEFTWGMILLYPIFDAVSLDMIPRPQIHILHFELLVLHLFLGIFPDLHTLHPVILLLPRLSLLLLVFERFLLLDYDIHHMVDNNPLFPHAAKNLYDDEKPCTLNPMTLYHSWVFLLV